MFADTCLVRSATETKRQRGIERDVKTPFQIAIMGDSRLRQVYQALVRFLDTGLRPGLQFLQEMLKGQITNENMTSSREVWQKESCTSQLKVG